MFRRDSSLVCTYPPGPVVSARGVTLGTPPRWLSRLGHVAGLSYSWVLPGGPDQMQCTLQVPPQYRTEALNPGRIVRIFRGGSCIWDGKLDEPQPTTQGWTITAHGAGNFGTDYRNIWTSWDQNSPVLAAVARGLRWNVPTISSTGLYLLQQEDSGSQTITDFLNLLTTYGGYSWYVGRGNVLSVFPLPNTELPSAANRLLITRSPLARTIAADINTLVARYQATADDTTGTTGAVATYGLGGASVAASVAAHQPMEAYVDLTQSGVISLGTAQAAAAGVLTQFQRAAFTGSFTVQPGQLRTMGGAPVDLGSDQAGTVVRLLVSDYGYGGEVIPGPLQFIVGNYAYDDTTQTATVTPLQTVAQSMASLLAADFPGGAATGTAGAVAISAD
ncbi:MAG: hypothetical protein M3Y33_15645 [Actinomycetota bacterium]|nr:hypothetical protein [Actinomycetota bacterium]